MHPLNPRPRRMAFCRALVLVFVALLGACGERAVGGSGRLVGGDSGGAPRHLVVSGTPRQMGVWQGRLLRAEIRAAHRILQAHLLGRGGRGERLRTACLLYVDQALARMRESLRQELDGIAEGSGLAAEDLLLTEFMRDGIRFHDVPPGLVGTLACAGTGLEARCGFHHADAAPLAEVAMLVERRPEGGPATLLVAWPGSLGGLAGVSCRGLGVVAVEVTAPQEHQTLGGAPFTVRLREALERGRSAPDVIERLGGATAWRVLALDGPADVRLLGLAQVVGITTADLSAVPFFALPPTEAAAEVVVPSVSAEAPGDIESAFAAALPAQAVGWGLRWAGDAWHVRLGAATPARLGCDP